MSDGWIGADPIAMAALERELGFAAAAVRRAVAAIAEGADGLRWSGPDRARLRVLVSRARAHGDAVTARLRAAEATVRRNREAQVRCSRGGQGLTTAGLGRVGRWDDLVAAGARDLSLAELEQLRRDARDWAEQSGLAMLERLRGGPDHSLAAAWWRGLDEDQRAALEELYPELLSGVAGLPGAVLARATRRVVEERLGELVAEERTDEASAEIRVPLRVVDLVLGVGLGATLQQFRDGRVDVTLDLAGEVGVGGSTGPHVAGSLVGANRIAHTYSFGGRDEAEQFLDGLRGALLPSPAGLVQASVAMALTWTSGARLAPDIRAVDRYLGEHEARLVRTVIGGSSGARLEAGQAYVVEGRLDGSGGVEREWRRGAPASTTVFAAGELDLRALGNQAEGAARIGLRSVDGGGTALVLTGSVAGRHGLENLLDLASPGVRLATSQSGASASFEATMPITPANRDLVGDLARDPASAFGGDTLRALLDQSDLTVWTADQDHDSSGPDLFLLDVERSATTSTTRRTWVKPPNGRIVEVS